MIELSPFGLAMFTLAGLVSVGLLVALVWGWLSCGRQEERPPHVRDSAAHKRGV